MNRTLVSFVIITGGERNHNLSRLCNDLAADDLLPKEIIVVGDVSRAELGNSIIAVHRPDLASTGSICAMRNVAAAKSVGRTLVFLEDDVIVPNNWFSAIEPFLARISKGEVNLGGCRIVGPNGRRWYDWAWASRKNRLCPPMVLPYNYQSSNGYVSGCCMLMNRVVWQNVLFDETIKDHQREDVDFFHRAIDAGFIPRIFPYATIIHEMLPAGRMTKHDPGGGSDSFAKAIYAYRCGDIKKAQPLLESASSSIETIQLHYFRGLFSLFLHEYTAAIGHFESANQLDSLQNPGLSSQIFYRKGVAHLGLKESNKAKEAFTKVIEIFDDHPFARYRLNRL